MNALFLIRRSLRYVLHCGSAGMSGFRRREAILVNQLCLIGAASVLLYQTFFFIYESTAGTRLLGYNALFLAGYVGALVANGRGHNIAARNIPISIATVQIGLSTYLLGVESGIHFHYFALAGLASMIHTRVRGDITFALAVLFAALFLLCEFALAHTQPPIALSPGSLATVRAVSALATVFLCAFFAFVYRNAMAYAEHELAQANEELAELSGSDALTRLANRRRMEESLREDWRRLSRARLPLSVLMMDVDHFKAYNDRHGHQAGDECLRRLACLAMACVQRSADTVARYGGEEFIAILPETGRDDAMAIAERLREAVERTDMRDEGAETAGGEHITISIGVCTMTPAPDLTPQALIRYADRGLYEAKIRGRNRVVFCGVGDEIADPVTAADDQRV